MPSEEFEHAISVTKRPQTYALDATDTGDQPFIIHVKYVIDIVLKIQSTNLNQPINNK